MQLQALSLKISLASSGIWCGGILEPYWWVKWKTISAVGTHVESIEAKYIIDSDSSATIEVLFRPIGRAAIVWRLSYFEPIPGVYHVEHPASAMKVQHKII